MSILKISRVSFILSVIAFGLLHFVLDNYMTGKPAAEYPMMFILIGFIFRILLIVFALGIVMSDKPRVPATSLGILLLAWTCFRHLPLLITNLRDPGEWNSTGMAIAMAGGAFLLADSFSDNISKHQLFFRPMTSLSSTTSYAGRFLFGVPMCVFGMQHLLYSDFIASLIPSWIPGALFWAYGTGAALIAAGCLIILRIKIRWTAILLGTMLLLWLILVHFPGIVAQPQDAYEWTSAFQAWALSASAFVLSYTLKTQDGLRSVAVSKFEKIKIKVLVSKKGNSIRTPTEVSTSRRRDMKVQ